MQFLGENLLGIIILRIFYCDSGILAAIFVLNYLTILNKDGIKFSNKLKEIVKYYNSGEINFKIEEKSKAINEIKEYFTKKEEVINLYDFDGYRIEFKDWWFNIRASNTEPYLRLIVEANSDFIE